MYRSQSWEGIVFIIGVLLLLALAVVSHQSHQSVQAPARVEQPARDAGGHVMLQ